MSQERTSSAKDQSTQTIPDGRVRGHGLLDRKLCVRKTFDRLSSGCSVVLRTPAAAVDDRPRRRERSSNLSRRRLWRAA
eukprot:7253073-Prymnesium_polylepis.1